MNRLLTYSIASSVGLLIAGLLSIPTITAMRIYKPPVAAPAPGAAAAEIAAPATTAKPPVENQTLLRADIPSGQIVVTVNGSAAGSLQSTTDLDISSFCHPGPNTVRCMWVGPVQGSVSAVHTEAGTTRDLTDIHFVPADTETAGVREMLIYL